jgi:hypothetical protein
MKKVILSVFVIALFTIFSCNRDKTDFLSDEEESMISNDAAVESVYESMNYETDFFTGSDAAIMESGGSTKAFGFWRRYLLEIGPDITVEPEGFVFPKTVTIDYGDGIELVNGRFISGIVQIDVSAPPRELGATRDISFEDFYIDSVNIDGNIVKTCTDTSETYSEFTALSDLVFTFSDETYIERHAERITVVEGVISTPYDYSDDVLTISGFADSESSEGVSFSRVITEPLIKPATCRFITQGMVNFYKNDDLVAELDYGNGVCDDLAIITKDGESRQITLGKRRRIFRGNN